MAGLIIDGKEIDVPEVSIRNFKKEPKLALRVGRSDGANDGGVRTLPVSLVVLHTTKGIPGGKDLREQVIKPGLGPNTQAEDRTATFWSTDPTPSGAHIVVDHDGTAACLADLSTVCAYHAGQFEVNNRSIGIEIFQGSDAELYAGQLDAVRKIVDVITEHFGIQRQIPSSYNNSPIHRLVIGGRDLIGVVGHRDVSDQRGKGDPGDAIMATLATNGYEKFDFIAGRDKETWITRQTIINAELKRRAFPTQLTVDGIPGPQTTNALRYLGYSNGLLATPAVDSLTMTVAKFGTGSGHNQFESIIDAFFPTLVTSVGGNSRTALGILQKWLNQQQS